MELDTSSIEKRFAFGFLQQLLRWMDISQEFIAHLGTDRFLISNLLLPSSGFLLPTLCSDGCVGSVLAVDRRGEPN